MRHKADRGTRGSAFILALVASVIVFAIVMSITAVSTQESTEITNTRTREGARFIAEAALNLCAVSYQQDGSGPPGGWGSPMPLGGGTYRLIGDRLLEGPELRRLITVEGVVDDESYRVEAVVGPKTEALFETAVQANSNVQIDQNTRIDSWDSEVGAYDPLNPGSEGGIVGNGSIAADSGSVIDGDVQVAGTISLSGATITGTSEENGDGVDLASVDGLINAMAADFAVDNDNASLDPAMMAVVDGFPAISVGKLKTHTITAGDYYLHSITFGREGTLLLDTSGGEVRVVIHTGDVTMGQYSNLEVTGDGRATFYLAGPNRFFMGQYSDVTNAWGRTDLFMVVIGSTPTLSGDLAKFEMARDNTFYGTVWAPNADVHLHQGTEMWGAIIGNRVHFNQSNGLHYDVALQDSLWVLNFGSYKVYFQRRAL